MRRTGYLADPHDPKDWGIDKLALTGTVPDSASLRAQAGRVFDQRNLGSCVAQSVAKAIYISHRKQGVTNPDEASRLAIYYLARATHHMQHFDTGTYIRAAFQVLNALGFAPEDEWPYDVRRFADMPPTSVFRAGFDAANKPASYYRIFETGAARIAAVKRAISGGHAVVFGADVGSTFTRNAFDASSLVDPRDGEHVGGHAMVLAEYDFDGAWLINSWGESWGANGWAHVYWDFVAQGMRDVWVVEHAPPHQEDIYVDL